MSAGLQREKSLEQSKAQLQLDWEGRMEEVERKAYGKHQDIIQQLTHAKDKVGKLKIQCIHVMSVNPVWIEQCNLIFKSCLAVPMRHSYIIA